MSLQKLLLLKKLLKQKEHWFPKELEKLRLLYGEGLLDEQQVRNTVANSAHFDIFDLVDEALAGSAERVSKIFYGLLAEGMEPILMLWALHREILQLCKMSAGMAAGLSISAVMGEYRVWQNRIPLVRAALQRHSRQVLEAMLIECSRIDRINKGMEAGNARNELLELALKLAGEDCLEIGATKAARAG